MTLIEGVGDEVTDFFIVLGAMLVGWLAWCSTSIADQPLIRIVLVLQDRTRTRIAELRANHQNNNTVNQSPNIEVSEEDSVEINSMVNNDVDTSYPDGAITNISSVSPEPARTVATTSEEVLIQTMDSFSNEETTLIQRTPEVNATDTEQNKNVTESENNVTSNIASEESSMNSTNEISIKLKFINDDLKVVTGSLKEMLGDFKRRHFQMELESQKLVRLIFNGQVLQPDSQTLERCGLYNNCVVHCLVHQPPPSPVVSVQASALNNSSIYFNPQTFQNISASAGISSVHNEWDLSRFLVSILTLVLGLAWYSRYHYAQLFTATTTLALYALTAIFTVSLFCNFLPDQEGIRNIE